MDIRRANSSNYTSHSLLALHGRWDLALEPLLAARAAGELREELDLVRALWQAGRTDEARDRLTGSSEATREIWVAALGESPR